MKALVSGGHACACWTTIRAAAPRRLTEVEKDIEFIGGDIRDAATVENAAQGMDEVYHLAFINGTEFFYKKPELVLDVGVRGMINVVDACCKHGIGTWFLLPAPKFIRRRRIRPPNRAAVVPIC